MGNCNSVDPACATLEYPMGIVEKLDLCSSSARQLMLQHPGHYVALLPPPSESHGAVVKQKLKLLPPDTMLQVGSCYRLVSFEDVLLELSDLGNMTHQSSRKTSTTASKNQHQVQPSEVSTAAAKRVNQLRAMLSKPSTVLQQETVMVPQISSIQAPLVSQYAHVQRVRSWRPKLQSISERGR